MTWPAPDALEPPAPPAAPAAPPPTPEAQREPSALRTALARVPTATWVAAVGGALVLVAAAIVVVGNWDAIGRSVRVAGLALGTAGLLAASERLRRLTPSTASVVAHLGTFLTATVGIATMSLFGFTWPACLAVGGALAIAATELQRPRWIGGAMSLGQVGAIAMAATGAGALTGTTSGLLAVIAAAALLVCGAERRAAALALLAVCSPALVALSDAGIGAGTLRRAGLVGAELSWSGPVVGLLAAMVLGVVAARRGNNGLMTAATIAPVVGAVTGLAAIDGPAVAWWCVPAFVVIAAELTWWLLPSEGLRREIGIGVDVVSATVAIGVTLVAPEFAAPTTAVPLAATLLAVALATTRWRHTERRLADLGLAAIAIAVIATTIAVDAPSVVAAGVAVIATIGSGWLSRRFHPVAVYVPAYWAAATIANTVTADDTTGRLIVAVGLVGVLVAFAVAVRSRLAADHPWWGPAEVAALLLGTALTVAVIVDNAPAPAAFAAFTATGVAIALVERRFVGWVTGFMPGALAPVALAAAVDDQIGWLAVGAGVAAVGMVGVWLRHRVVLAADVSAGAAVVALAVILLDWVVTLHEFRMLGICALIALTGIALVTGRRSPVDAAAMTIAAILPISLIVGVVDVWDSLGWTVVGLHLALIGMQRRRSLLAGVGSVVTTAGLVSAWFTSGWHEVVTGWLEPADVRVGDIWMLVATLAAFVAGRVVRSKGAAGSWLAYGPGLAIAAAWILPVQAERATAWALPLGLAIGLTAVVIGAARRLAGPLVGGAALTAGVLFVAIDADVAAIPAWVWFAVGGLSLLVAATLIERGSRSDTSLRELVDAWE